MNSIPKYRWPLNKDQLEVLNLLYKFRFASSDLIAQYFQKPNGSHVYKRLKILQEQGFIGRRYSNIDRIQGKPVAYHLWPNGLRRLNELRVSEDKEPIDVSRLYRETRVTEGFVQYCMDTFSIYLKLNAQFGDNLSFLTKNQLTGRYDYFEDFIPGVYFRLKAPRKERDYFLEYLQSSKPFFAHTKRLKQYIDYADDGAWEAATDSDFPKVLLVCDSSKLQKRLFNQADNILEDADEELNFYLITKKELEQSDESKLHNLANPNRTLSLSQI